MVEPADVNDIMGVGPRIERLNRYRLHLFTDGLLSKWGFGDGDEDEALLDYLEEAHLKLSSDWHDVLRLLVRRHLLPALNRKVEVCNWETCHNPVRAETIDGVEVPWSVITGREPSNYGLTPDHVEVTWDQIRQADDDCVAGLAS